MISYQDKNHSKNFNCKSDQVIIKFIPTIKVYQLSFPSSFNFRVNFKCQSDDKLSIKFENELKKFTKSRYVLSVINGTSALHLAIVVLGIKENEEIRKLNDEQGFKLREYGANFVLTTTRKSRTYKTYKTNERYTRLCWAYF